MEWRGGEWAGCCEAKPLSDTVTRRGCVHTLATLIHTLATPIHNTDLTDLGIGVIT